MDRPAEDLTLGRRPRDLALMLLAIGSDPPRARARDQQADRAGGELRRRVLDRLEAIDPDPEALEQALIAIIEEIGEPTGPTRGVCTTFRDEWEQVRAVPEAWAWLISEAIAMTGREENPRRRRPRGAS